MSSGQGVKIFLDLDGTLLDVSNRHFEVYAFAVEQFGGTPLSKRLYWQLKRCKTGWPQLLARSGLDPHLLSPFHNAFLGCIEAPEMLAKDQLFVGTKSSLGELSSAHSLSLLTLRRSRANLMDQLRDLDLQRYFDEIEVGHARGEAYEAKLELMKKVSAFREVIAVGDTEADIVAAKMLHVPVVAVLSGLRDHEYLGALEPDFMIGGIRELPDLVRTL